MIELLLLRATGAHKAKTVIELAKLLLSRTAASLFSLRIRKKSKVMWRSLKLSMEIKKKAHKKMNQLFKRKLLPQHRLIRHRKAQFFQNSQKEFKITRRNRR